MVELRPSAGRQLKLPYATLVDSAAAIGLQRLRIVLASAANLPDPNHEMVDELVAIAVPVGSRHQATRFDPGEWEYRVQGLCEGHTCSLIFSSQTNAPEDIQVQCQCDQYGSRLCRHIGALANRVLCDPGGMQFAGAFAQPGWPEVEAIEPAALIVGFTSAVVSASDLRSVGERASPRLLKPLTKAVSRHVATDISVDTVDDVAPI